MKDSTDKWIFRKGPLITLKFKEICMKSLRYIDKVTAITTLVQAMVDGRVQIIIIMDKWPHGRTWTDSKISLSKLWVISNFHKVINKSCQIFNWKINLIGKVQRSYHRYSMIYKTVPILLSKKWVVQVVVLSNYKETNKK